MAHNRSNFSFPRPQHPTLSYLLNLSDFLLEKVTIGFSASTGLSNQMHNLISWNFSSQTSWSHDKERLSIIIISLVAVFVAVVAVILIIGVGVYRLNYKKRVTSDRDLHMPDPSDLKSHEVLERVDEETNPNRSPRVYRYACKYSSDIAFKIGFKYFEEEYIHLDIWLCFAFCSRHVKKIGFSD
ncbi:hypothetical protein SUGI_0890580 [Cryptomeria japonica]|nr:hypothetical protein SUGI_0890580 [Cryptomeria japonica]